MPLYITHIGGYLSKINRGLCIDRYIWSRARICSRIAYKCWIPVSGSAQNKGEDQKHVWMYKNVTCTNCMARLDFPTEREPITAILRCLAGIFLSLLPGWYSYICNIFRCNYNLFSQIPTIWTELRSHEVQIVSCFSQITVIFIFFIWCEW